jgi:AraC family transcriptional regulator
MSALVILPAGAASSVKGSAQSIVRIAPPDIARRHVTTLDAIQVDAVEVLRREPYEYGFKAPRHMLIMSERQERDDGETLIEGLPKSTLREFSHKLSFVPAGHRFFGWQKPRVLARVTYFYIDPRGPGVDHELNFAETELKPRLFFFDQDLWETARKLKAQGEKSDPDHRQYTETLGILLMHELLRLNSGVVTTREYLRGGLAEWQQKRVAEYIEEYLSETIALAALAELAKLSPFHFARAFKQSFGLPPHQYLSSRRMEKAMRLLENPSTPVIQIALDVGFRDVSAFSTRFRKHTGLSPASYRRSL